MTKDFYQLEFKNEVIYMDPLISKLWTVLNFKVLTSTVLRSASRVQRPGFRVQRPGSNVQSPTSRVQRPESSVQLLRPEFRNSSMPFKIPFWRKIDNATFYFLTVLLKIWCENSISMPIYPGIIYFWTWLFDGAAYEGVEEAEPE